MPCRRSFALVGSSVAMPALLLRLFLMLSLVLLVRAGAQNITIDDENGDEKTGVQPVYQPKTSWSLGSACAACWAKPNSTDVTDGTWHDTTAFNSTPSNVTIQFTGKISIMYRCPVILTCLQVEPCMSSALSRIL
jgi:hypothetical protein